MAEQYPEKSKSSPLMAAVVILLLTLIGGGAGFAVGSMLKAPDLPAVSASTIAVENKAQAPPVAQGGHGEKSADASSDGEMLPPIIEEQAALTVVPLAPILTNLAEPKNIWVRLEGSLLIKKETEDPHELLAEKADENIVTFLRTVRMRDIEGPSGFLNFRADLNELVSGLSEGQVKQVIIHSVVFE